MRRLCGLEKNTWELVLYTQWNGRIGWSPLLFEVFLWWILFKPAAMCRIVRTCRARVHDGRLLSWLWKASGLEAQASGSSMYASLFPDKVLHLALSSEANFTCT